MFPDRASCPHWPSQRLMAGINICVEDDISPAFHGLECTSATTLLFICHMRVYPIVTKGWLAIAKLKPLSLFISLLSMPKKAFDNAKIEK